MGKRLLKLPRRLFGYQASSVDQLVADRDSMLGMAEQRVRSAEARIAELEEELSRRDEDIEAVKAGREPADDPPPAPPTSSFEGAQDSEEAGPVPAAPLSISPEPLVSPPPVPLAVDEADDDEADEVEEWPLPTIRPRTVEFIPPPEPSAEFDPMPIGGEDHEWSSPTVEHWGAGSGEPVADAESIWGAPAKGAAEDAPAAAEATSWVPEDEGTTDEPPAQADPWSIVEHGHDEPWTAVQDAIREPPEHQAEPLAESSAESAIPQFTPAYLSEELAHVVRAAEESATKIIERAWESTRTQIAQVDRLWREVQEEIIRFAAWRQHVDPMISTVQAYIEEARANIAQVPSRIQEALSPAAEAMARVDVGMSEFARASDLPQLLGKLHAEVAKTIDTGDFTRSTSDTADTTAASDSSDTEPEFEAPSDLPEWVEVHTAHENIEPSHADEQEEPASEGTEAKHQTPSNGGPRAHEDMDMARAIAHELRIINESGDPITSPDKT